MADQMDILFNNNHIDTILFDILLEKNIFRIYKYSYMHTRLLCLTFNKRPST